MEFKNIIFSFLFSEYCVPRNFADTFITGLCGECGAVARARPAACAVLSSLSIVRCGLGSTGPASSVLHYVMSRPATLLALATILAPSLVTRTTGTVNLGARPMFSGEHGDTVEADLGQDVTLHCQVRSRKYLNDASKIFSCVFNANF